MASLATTDKCPYCLQNINQGQSQYGPICNNGHRAHLNCIMKEFEHTGSFNIDTWTCPLCRAPAFYDPDPNSETPSLNQVLRDRFPRRIAKLEEREEDLGSGRISIDELSQQYPFLSSEYRENEQDYVMAIMTVLSINVRMNGVFPNTSQFQDTEDAENMGNILLTQWFEMYNMATAYEDEGDMEDFHSTLSNQSPFFRALTVAILLGYARGFWNLDLEYVGLLNDAQRRAAEADGIQTVNLSLRGGKRKKKTRRKRRGKKRKTRKKRGGAVTEFLVKNDQASINAFFYEIRRRQINGSYAEHSPSDELGLEHLEEMMMESLVTGEYVEGIYGVTYAPNRNEGPYGRFFADYFDDMDSLTERLEIVSENNRFPNDVAQLQSAVEEQIILPHPGGESPNTVMDVDDLSGGRKRHRKKKTRKKRGGTNQCSICLKDEEIVDDDNHIRLSCGHIFCKNCIRSWLDINNTCPYCRSEVSENDRNRLNPGQITCDGCGETISQHDYDNGDYYRPGDGSLEGNEDHIFCTDCGQNWVCTYCNEVILRAERDRNEWVPIGQSDIACEDCAADNLSDSESEMDVEQSGGKRRKKKTRKKKKQFLYNPDDPSKSFDVYIDKNPNDTIPIKYTTVKDVKNTIKKLERLYKTKKYPHKRIWQVGMIMKVRLEAMLKHKTKKYPNAKKVKQRFNLANKYFKFLGKRTKKKDFKSRKSMTFKL